MNENGAKAKFNDYESDLTEANSANNIFINDIASSNNHNNPSTVIHLEPGRVVIDNQSPTGDLRKIEYSNRDDEEEEGEASNEEEENNANGNQDDEDDE